MKNFLILIGFILIFYAGFSYAGEDQVDVFGGMAAMLLAKFPKIASLFVIMGGLRAIFKPLTMMIEAYVKYTDPMEDDARWGRAKQSSLFRLVEKALDMFASVKLLAKK